MTTTRNLLIQYVCAWDISLKETAHKMDLITLLRNAHPAYRSAFALTLMNENQITKEQGKEFIKLIGG